MLAISRIKEGSQARASINESTIQEYADHLTNGGSFPPVIVFFDSKDYWIADGWHRLIAHQRIGCLEILEEVHVGGQREALRYALGANNAHGLPRTNADKRNAVSIALSDAEWSKLPVREIAKICSVSHNLVSEMKQGLSPDDKTKKNKVAIPDKNSRLSPDDKKPPEPAVALKVEIPAPAENQESEPEYTELDQAHEQIEDLQNIIAAGFMATSDDDRASGLLLLAELRKEIKTLRATLSAVESTRDTLLNENAALKKQCLAQARKLKKFEGDGNV